MEEDIASGRVDRPEEGVEPEEVDKEELGSAKEVILSIAKASKTLKIYLPNNPIYQKFLQDAFQKFDNHLHGFGELRIRIKQFELLFKGQAIYENTDRMESIAFKLFADGVREMKFLEGIEKDEVVKFLGLIGGEYDPSNPDDDMVTLLWEKNFSHIKYTVAEDIQQSGELAPSIAMNPEFDMMLEQESSDIEALKSKDISPLRELLGPKFLDKPFSVVFKLTEDEIEKIRREIKAEEDLNPVNELIEILSDILLIEKDYESFSEIVKTLDNTLEALVIRGDFEHSVKILKFLRDLQSSNSLPENFKARLKASIELAGNSNMIRELELSINKFGQEDSGHLFTFFALLDKNALIPLSDLLGRIENIKIRRILCETLVTLGKDNVDLLSKKLGDERWYVVRNMVYILGKIGDPRVIADFKGLINHPEIKVRKEILHALEGMKDDRSKDLLVSFLDDRDSSMRIYAARALATTGYKDAAQIFLNMASRKEFEGRDFYEKKEMLESLSRIASDEVLQELKRLMKRRTFFLFKNEKRDEVSVCAVLALKKIGTGKAVEILREGSLLKNRVVREACVKALDELERGARK
ncbi:MAG: HEAT repeat domain-containing protein [Nitrospirota bacterium]